MIKKILFLIVIFLLCISSVDSVSTSGQIIKIPNDNAITSVDTDETGQIFIAGFTNGSITATDRSGVSLWKKNTNASIKKLITDYEGNTIFLNNLNETGYIDQFGNLRSLITTTDNVTDIGLSRDGSYFATSSYYPPKLTIYSSYGNLSGYNLSATLRNWTKIALDPDGEWLVSANASDSKLYLWNLTIYNGWEEFNPSHTFNQSLKFIDSFPYRQNISIMSYTNTTRLVFHNTSNTTYIQQINQTYYEYNPLNTGKYFYWATPHNYTDSQTSYLNLSYYENSTNDLLIITKPNWKNFTIYYGNLTDQPFIYQGDIYRAYQTFATTGSTWVVPNNVTKVANLTIIGPGGTGGAGGGITCSDTYGYGAGGVGGYNGSNTTHGATITVSGSYALTYANAFGYSASAGANGATGAYGPYGTPQGLNGNYGNGNASMAGTDGNYNFMPGGGGTGGSGYGAGGGGGQGGFYQAGSGCAQGVAGGAGSPAWINFTYWNDTVVITPGKNATISNISPKQSSQAISYLTYVTSTDLASNVQQVFVPEDGNYISASTDSIIYLSTITKNSFGTSIVGPASSLNSNTISAADGGAYVVDGRGSFFYIYDSEGDVSGVYNTGGTLNSIDIGMKNGLWAAAGGQDGKLYVMSKDVSSDWYVYYQGEVGNSINSVGMTWRGEYVCVGRSDGYFECYDNNAQMGTDINTEIFVYKNGAPYQTTVSIRETNTYPYVFHDFTTPIVATDTIGKASVVGMTIGYTYELTVDGKITYYTASDTTKQIVISIDTTPQIVGGYNYTATNVNTSYPGNLTITYNDNIIPNSVIIKVAEKDTGLIIYNQQFNNDPDIKVIVPANPTVNYEVQWVWDRDGVRGLAGKTLFIPRGGGFNFGNVDQNVKYALFYIAFLFVCGLFTYATRTIGAFISAIFYVFLVVMQILPFTLLNIAGIITILTITAVFGEAKERR